MTLRAILLASCALLMGGCVNPMDPLRLAARGPGTGAWVVQTERPMQVGDRIALVVLASEVDEARLRRCVQQGIEARLPRPGPQIVALEAEAAGRLAAALAVVPRPATLPEEVAALGADWAVTVRDVSTHSARSDSEPIVAEGGVGYYAGERTDHALRLQGEVVDLRGRRRLGEAMAWYDARGGGGVAAGIAGGGGIIFPFIMPVVRLPAGTSAMAICNAFGRTIGDALVKATTPGQAPAASATTPQPAARP